MPITRTVSDAATLVASLVKNPGNFQSVAVACADMVSSEMWYAAPWKFNGVIAEFASGAITLSDGIQDYSPPAQIYRLIEGRLIRTDVSPNESQELNVEDSLYPDLKPRAWNSIAAISLEAAVGQLRLEAAVQVPSGVTLEIGGRYQLHHNKITTLSTPLWFPDEYFDVFVAGLLFWAYRLADDPRAGGIINRRGAQLASGQYAEFKAKLEAMMEAEDYGGDEQLIPSEGLGGKYAPGGIFGIY